MQLLIDVLSRWTHIGTVITVLGGSVFMRFILMPATAGLSDEEHAAFRERVMNRWKRVVHAGILLFIVSGFYNYFRAIPLHKGDRLYNPLIVIKILLAFVIFFFASALVGRSPAFQSIRDNAKKWLGLIIILGAIIVGISGYAKVALKPTSGSNPPAIITPAE